LRVKERWQKDNLVETEKSGFLIPTVEALKEV